MVSKSPVYKSVVIESSAVAVEGLCRQLLAEAAGNNFNGDDIFAIHLAVGEALLNAVQHGNKTDAGKQISIECLITPEKFDISITDQGTRF